MSPKEMEKSLDLIDDMFDIEDDMIIFLESEKSHEFIKDIIQVSLKDNGIKINKLVKNQKEIKKFEESLIEHFQWIKNNIDDDTEHINDYRVKQINIKKAYELFYKKAIKNISSYIDEKETCDEIIKYFDTLKSFYS